MRLVRVLIWIATAAFVVMLFAPLVKEMSGRIRIPLDAGVPP